ncbi:MAG: hypothetical protein LBU00_01820 [Treponema sp.]|jgi:hypothetical protein|nr:hypothetical protein [Treponema sp.]
MKNCAEAIETAVRVEPHRDDAWLAGVWKREDGGGLFTVNQDLSFAASFLIPNPATSSPPYIEAHIEGKLDASNPELLCDPAVGLYQYELRNIMSPGGDSLFGNAAAIEYVPVTLKAGAGGFVLSADLIAAAAFLGGSNPVFTRQDPGPGANGAGADVVDGASDKVSAGGAAGEVLVPRDVAGVNHSGYFGVPDMEYAFLDELGVSWVHRDFSWDSIERSDDSWNFADFDRYVQEANARGKKVLGMLLYDVPWVHAVTGGTTRSISAEEIPYFVDYAKKTVERYNGKNGFGKVDGWCIWNEPNIERFWLGSPGEFGVLSAATARALKEDIDSGGALILGGVFAPYIDERWIRSIFESGAMEFCDGIAFHPYSFTAAGAAAVFNAFKEKVAPYGFADKIWINEIGYPAVDYPALYHSIRYGTETPEPLMPETTVKTFASLAAGGAKMVMWYHLFDGSRRADGDPEAWFGLLWPGPEGMVKKGGYWAYALCARHLAGMTWKPGAFPHDTIDGVEFYYFEDRVKRTLIIWNNSYVSSASLRLTIRGKNRLIHNISTGGSEQITADTTTVTLGAQYRPAQDSLLFITWEDR